MSTKYINQQVAKQTAKSMTDKLFKEVVTLREDLSTNVSELYIKEIDPRVIDLFNDRPNYFNKVSTIYLSGNGLNQEMVVLSKSLPGQGSYSHTIQPSKAEAVVLANKLKKIEYLLSQRDNLVSKIVSALTTLRTYKKVADEFPEAYQFLPNSNSEVKTLTVPLKDIRAELKKIV